jgi:transcriptional regulator with GAF, ATPase, and Fis domain
VLITGESGTGKELVARAIHRASPRSARPFVATNCAALTETLLESELFGHEKGAFTGAYKQRIGRFELAEGGTLFLDEIGEVSGGFQAKLLRALEQHEIVRVGAAEPIGVDARVIAATNRTLTTEVNAGRFRSDLFFRLNVFPIVVPPLRDRVSDIEALATHFLRRLRYVKPELSDGVVAALQSYSWPGNIRELRNILERATILAGGAALSTSHLGFLPGQQSAPSAPVTPPASAAPRVPPTAPGLDGVERRAIEEALIASRGNKSNAARRLGITRRVLYTKLHKHGLD